MTNREAAYPRMSLREYIATQAMVGLITGITSFRMAEIITNRPQEVSELACLYADALINELDKPMEKYEKDKSSA